MSKMGRLRLLPAEQRDRVASGSTALELNKSKAEMSKRSAMTHACKKRCTCVYTLKLRLDNGPVGSKLYA